MFFRYASRIDGFFSKKGKKPKKIEKKGLHFPKSRDILSNVPSEQVNTARGISTVGSALHSHCRGQRFESAMLHQTQEIRTSSRLGWVRISSFYLKYCGVNNKMNERRQIGITPIVPALKITIGQELTSTECERLPYFTNGFMPFPASSSGSRSGTSPCGRRYRPIAAALRASPSPPLRRPSAPRSDPRRKRCASDEQ